MYTGANMSNGSSPNPAFLAYTTGQYPNGTDVASMWLYTADLGDLFAIDYNHQLQSRRAKVFIASTGAPNGGLSEASYNQTYCEVAFSSHVIQVHGKANDYQDTCETCTLLLTDTLRSQHDGANDRQQQTR